MTYTADFKYETPSQLDKNDMMDIELGNMDKDKAIDLLIRDLEAEREYGDNVTDYAKHCDQIAVDATELAEQGKAMTKNQILVELMVAIKNGQTDKENLEHILGGVSGQFDKIIQKLDCYA